MNDAELNQMLDSWEAPAPAASLREGLLDRFPRAEPRRFGRKLVWALATVAASLVLVIGLGQGADYSSDFPMLRFIGDFYNHILDGFDLHQMHGLMVRIEQSSPRVSVDGQPAAPLVYGPGTAMSVEVPGGGTYKFISVRRREEFLLSRGGTPAGWVDAGHIHGSMIEFEAGGKQVRIECNQPIADSDRVVFVRRLQ
jgi:hypothetical protein